MFNLHQVFYVSGKNYTFKEILNELSPSLENIRFHPYSYVKHLIILAAFSFCIYCFIYDLLPVNSKTDLINCTIILGFLSTFSIYYLYRYVYDQVTIKKLRPIILNFVHELSSDENRDKFYSIIDIDKLTYDEKELIFTQFSTKNFTTGSLNIIAEVLHHDFIKKESLRAVEPPTIKDKELNFFEK